MSQKFLKFQEAEKERIAKLENFTLLEAALNLAGGDDFDGSFTKEGEIEYDLMKEELSSRLSVWLDGRKLEHC